MNDSPHDHEPPSVSPYAPQVSPYAPQIFTQPNSTARVGTSAGYGGTGHSKHVKYACICLHISAVLYVLVGLAVAAIFIGSAMADDKMNEGAMPIAVALAVAMFGFCAAIAVAVEIVAWALRRRKTWGWIAGLVVFGLYVPSLYFPLGAVGLWALLHEDARKEFEITAI